MARMVIVTSMEEWQEGAHLVPEDVYGKVALLIMTEMHDLQRSPTLADVAWLMYNSLKN